VVGVAVAGLGWKKMLTSVKSLIPSGTATPSQFGTTFASSR
jgi:hypothetical protein